MPPAAFFKGEFVHHDNLQHAEDPNGVLFTETGCLFWGKRQWAGSISFNTFVPAFVPPVVQTNIPRKNRNLILFVGIIIEESEDSLLDSDSDAYCQQRR